MGSVDGVRWRAGESAGRRVSAVDRRRVRRGARGVVQKGHAMDAQSSGEGKMERGKHDEDGLMLNPMSSSWHSLFQKHRGQFPVCDTVRPTMGWPQQPIQRAQVGHPLKSHLDPTPSWSHGGSVPVVPASLASNRHGNHLHCCFRPRHDPPQKHSRPPLPHQNRKGATRPPPLVTTVPTPVPVVDGPPDPLVPVGAGVVSTPGPGLVRLPCPVPSRDGPENKNKMSASTPPPQEQTTYTPPSPPW